MTGEAESAAVLSELATFALEQCSEGVWQWDIRSGRVVASGNAYRLVGLAPTAGKPEALWAELLHPEDRESALRAFREGVTSGRDQFDFEFRAMHADGSYRTFLCRSLTHARDPGGRATILRGTVQDITERRRPEAASAASEAQYRTLVASQGEGIGIVDVEERFVFVNPAAEEILGVRPGELQGVALREFFDEEQYAKLLAQTDRRRSGERSTYEVDFIRRSDEQRRTMLVTATPRFDVNGAYTGAFGVFRDITERRRAEAAVRESEERYRQLIESLPHGVGVVSRSEIKFANRAAAAILGYASPAELVGVAPLAPLAVGEAEHVASMVRGLLQGDVPGPIHYFARASHRDGREVPVEVFASRVSYGGEPALQVFMMDLTERHRADAERAGLEEELRQARRMESLGRLAGGIAHDFNNLLVPILSLSQIALQDLDPSHPLHGELATIHDAAERAAHLTRQLLAFGRRQVLCMRILDVNAVVGESLSMLRRLIPENVQIELELGRPPALVRADKAQLQQILLNLTVNARDAMPNGGTVTVRTGALTFGRFEAPPALGLDPGSHAFIEVADTGHGMDAATRSRVFEPFFTTKGIGQGVGLGLATVHGIVTQHGGRITVDSVPGKGTTFWIYLPLAEGAAEETERPSWQVAGGKAAGTVLVVEDEAAVRNVACKILRRRGLDVIEARDGEEALVLAERHAGPIHVLLTDVIMPRMDGGELGRRLSLQSPETVIVYMSGYADEVIARHGVIEDGVLFVQKPFTVASLLDKVEKALKVRE